MQRRESGAGVALGTARRAHQTTSNGERGNFDMESELKAMADEGFSDELEDEPAGVVGNIVRVVKAGASIKISWRGDASARQPDARVRLGARRHRAEALGASPRPARASRHR